MWVGGGGGGGRQHSRGEIPGVLSKREMHKDDKA